MGKIVNINGNPYTSAQEDLGLWAVQKKLRGVVTDQLAQALHTGKLHTALIEDLLLHAYHTGHQDSDNTPPHPTPYYFVLLDAYRAALQVAVQEAVQTIRNGRISIHFGVLDDLLARAYYLGRDEGAK